DPRDWARAHKEFGYRAAYCPDIQSTDTERIAAVKAAFKAQDVEIAEVGAWRNLVSPDPVERKANVLYACERLILAEQVGARCCVAYIGTVAPGSDYGPHPDNLTRDGFDRCVETARSVIDQVKPSRTKFALEMMQWLIPDSPECYLELIKAVDRPAFGAHLDPVNLILSPRQYFDSGSLIRRCFELLGPWICSAHAKDIILRGELALHFDEIRPGLGELDYAIYLTELERHSGDAPLMLEHLADEDYPAARDFVKETGRKLGIEI
ncbi:MAG: sugar phosphate isomerase/epimerase, partial [Verrucomicrobia bacterium]|nr:sugar phosphate isomerase/epimerase [Verrucomicrobiota bacterium]